MRTLPPIDPAGFVAAVQPHLAKPDLSGLISLLRTRWNPSQILALLSCDDDDARKVALLALGLVGSRCCTSELVRQLRDPDPMINQMAEHALWLIWFRGPNPDANQHLARGAKGLNCRKFQQAVEHFTTAIQIDPTFAEAYNQRAIAHYLQEDYRSSISDCERAVELMPCHFGAWAGLGHAHALLGEAEEAIRCYQKALEINPHLPCVREAVQELRRRQRQA